MSKIRSEFDAHAALAQQSAGPDSDFDIERLPGGDFRVVPRRRMSDDATSDATEVFDALRGPFWHWLVGCAVALTTLAALFHYAPTVLS